MNIFIYIYEYIYSRRRCRRPCCRLPTHLEKQDLVLLTVGWDEVLLF